MIDLNQDIQSALVDLDCLLDTRLGALRLIDEPLSWQLYYSGDHDSRMHDSYPGIIPEMLTKALTEAPYQALKNSTLTSMIYLLDQIAMKLAQTTDLGPAPKRLKLDVNCYPFILDDEEKELMLVMLRQHLTFVDNINLVFIPTQELTVAAVKDSYQLVIKYDYLTWLNSHLQEFETTLIPLVMLLGPAIYFKTPPTSQEIEKALKNPFEAIEVHFMLLITLRLIDVHFFSAITPRTLLDADKGSLAEVMHLSRELTALSSQEISNPTPQEIEQISSSDFDDFD